MFDEKALRKPEFDPNSAPVVMADGQTWSVPKPWLRLRPRFAAGKPVGQPRMLTDDADWNGLKMAVLESEDGDSFGPIAALGAHMLLRNYDLTDDQLSVLFAWDQGMTWPGDIMQVANGTSGPKPSSGGDI